MIPNTKKELEIQERIYSLGVVDVLVTRQSAVDRLPEKVGQLNLSILSPAGVGQVLGDEVAQTQSRKVGPIPAPESGQRQIPPLGGTRRSKFSLQRGINRLLKKAVGLSF